MCSMLSLVTAGLCTCLLNHASFFYIKWNGQFQNEKRTKAQMFQVSCIAKVFFFLMGRELNFL